MIALLLSIPLCAGLGVTPAQLESEARRRIANEFERVGRVAPREDRSLSDAAGRLAAITLKHGAKSAGLVAQVADAVSDAGGFDPAPLVLVIHSGASDDVLGSLQNRKDLSQDPASVYGVAAKEASGSIALVFLLAQRKVELDPFPRAPKNPKAVQVLCGELRAPLERAELYVTRPKGGVDKIAAKMRGTRFCGALSFPEPGRHTVEVLGKGPRGPEVAALFFVQSGRIREQEAHRSSDEPTTVAEAQKILLHRINELRKAHGAPPLVLHPTLSAVAQRYSERMKTENYFAHVAPDGSDLKARLTQAGFTYESAGENLGMAPGPLAAHFGIELSPGHRKNLLDPKFQLLGLGIAFRTQSKDGRAEAILTEILARTTADSKDPLGDAYASIARKRLAAKLPPLRRNFQLEQLALEHARRALESNAPHPVDGNIHDRVFRVLGEVRTAAVDLFIADQPAQLGESKNLLDAANHHVGIGAVKGSSPRFGPNKYWVVVIYAG